MLPLWESFDSSALATSITSLHKDRKTLLIPSFEAFGLTKGNSALSGWQFICLHVDVEKVKAAVMLNFRVAVSWNQGISELAILSFRCVLWMSDHTHYNPSSVLHLGLCTFLLFLMTVFGWMAGCHSILIDVLCLPFSLHSSIRPNWLSRCYCLCASTIPAVFPSVFSCRSAPFIFP